MSGKQHNYFIVYYIVRKPFYSERNHLRWAFGDEVGAQFLLGVYTTEKEARTVYELLRKTRPARHKYVSVRTKRESARRIHDKLAAQAFSGDAVSYELNLFYPESILNGCCKSLPAVATENLAAFLKVTQAAV